MRRFLLDTGIAGPYLERRRGVFERAAAEDFSADDPGGRGERIRRRSRIGVKDARQPDKMGDRASRRKRQAGERLRNACELELGSWPWIFGFPAGCSEGRHAKSRSRVSHAL